MIQVFADDRYGKGCRGFLCRGGCADSCAAALAVLSVSERAAGSRERHNSDCPAQEAKMASSAEVRGGFNEWYRDANSVAVSRSVLRIVSGRFEYLK